MLPVELYHEIFQYIRPCERMILNEIDSIKSFYQNFVKTTIWPKLFKDLILPNKTNKDHQILREDESYDDYSTNRIIYRNNRNTPIITKIDSISFGIDEIKINNYMLVTPRGVVSHFLILGKNITKVELYSSDKLIRKQYFLKKEIVKVTPYNNIYFPFFMGFNIKVYSDSIDKIYAKYYIIDYESNKLFSNSISDDILYNNNSIKLIMYSHGISGFAYTDIGKNHLHMIDELLIRYGFKLN